MLSVTLENYLESLKKEGLHREKKVVKSDLLNFCSNDYLSLTNEPQIRSYFQQGFDLFPTGSGGSAVICGQHAIHKELEESFANALDVDCALLFNSGYSANLAIINLLSHFQSHLCFDKAVHASFYDGIKANQSAYSRYFHNDLEHLKQVLQPLQSAVVITESVFSMSGQISDLQQISALCQQFRADCIIDEAHAFGVFGPEGLGLVARYQLSQDDIPLRMIPFGKAFGFQGAIVAGRAVWIDALLQLGRSSIYSTAISPALAHGMLKTLDFIRKAEDRRQKLFRLIEHFRVLCKQSHLLFRDSQTQIQQLQLGCPHKALMCAQFLAEHGIFCQAIRAPTVSKKDTGLRIILNYQHEPVHLEKLFKHLHHSMATSYVA